MAERARDDAARRLSFCPCRRRCPPAQDARVLFLRGGDLVVDDGFALHAVLMALFAGRAVFSHTIPSGGGRFSGGRRFWISRSGVAVEVVPAAGGENVAVRRCRSGCFAVAPAARDRSSAARPGSCSTMMTPALPSCRGGEEVEDGDLVVEVEMRQRSSSRKSGAPASAARGDGEALAFAAGEVCTSRFSSAARPTALSAVGNPAVVPFQSQRPSCGWRPVSAVSSTVEAKAS